MASRQLTQLLISRIQRGSPNLFPLLGASHPWGGFLRGADATCSDSINGASGSASKLPFFSPVRLAHGMPVTNGPGGCPHGPAAFVFDIDGVLLHGRQVLPSAREAVDKLVDRSGRWRFPVVFMTNGGGTSEARRAAQLTEFLGIEVKPEQVLLSHTPMQDLVPSLGEHPVLISGKGDVAEVAVQYGFRRGVHAKQLGAAMPAATPFTKYPPSTDAKAPCPVQELGLGTAAAPFRAVLVMTDPDDWYRDLQLIIDVVAGAGVPGRDRSDVPEGAPEVAVYYSAGDLVWANDFPTNRLGQGAFASVVEHLYRQVHGVSLPNVKFFGKPQPEPYRMAERLLVRQARELDLIPADHPMHSVDPQDSRSVSLPFSAIYAIGDNPASDVRGANCAGKPWVSVLVHTGVFKGPGRNCSKDIASVAVPDVRQAVEAALHRARNSRWHSMR